MPVSVGHLERTNPITPASQRLDYSNLLGTQSSRQPSLATNHPRQASSPVPQRPEAQQAPQPGVGEGSLPRPPDAESPLAPVNGPSVSNATRDLVTALWALLKTSLSVAAKGVALLTLILTALGVGWNSLLPSLPSSHKASPCKCECVVRIAQCPGSTPASADLSSEAQSSDQGQSLPADGFPTVVETPRVSSEGGLPESDPVSLTTQVLSGLGAGTYLAGSAIYSFRQSLFPSLAAPAPQLQLQ